MLASNELCALIPHDGAMCLLDTVEAWDDGQITCRAVSQAEPGNPLSRDGVIPAVMGVEYAAQAMAVHGALLAGNDGPPRRAFLAALRSVELSVDTLQQFPELQLHCQRLGGDANGFIYQFTVSAAGVELLSGRATVMNEQEGTA